MGLFSSWWSEGSEGSVSQYQRDSGCSMCGRTSADWKNRGKLEIWDMRNFPVCDRCGSILSPDTGNIVIASKRR